MRKLIAGVAAALSFAATSALADGPYRRPPPTIAAPIPEAPPFPTWTGFYLGAGIGAGAVVHDVSLFDNLGTFARLDGIGGEGVFGTVILGWDWQVGSSTVFGVFVDYDFSDISTTASAFDSVFRASLDHDNSWSVGARLGWLSNPATLWYLTGGYTEADFNASARIVDDNIFSLDRTFSGYFVGGGVEARLQSNWSLRLEYRYSEFDSERRFFDPPDDLGIRFEPSMHTARLTLSYRFGSGYGWGWGTWGQ